MPQPCRRADCLWLVRTKMTHLVPKSRTSRPWTRLNHGLVLVSSAQVLQSQRAQIVHQLCCSGIRNFAPSLSGVLRRGRVKLHGSANAQSDRCKWATVCNEFCPLIL